MSNANCCVSGCSNTYKKNVGNETKIRFYKFSSRPWQKERMSLWTSFAKRINRDGTPWKPSLNAKICSAHFIGNEKSEDPRKPNFNPTIHPNKKTSHKVDPDKVMTRRNSFRRRPETNIALNNKDHCNCTDAEKAKSTVIVDKQKMKVLPQTESVEGEDKVTQEVKDDSDWGGYELHVPEIKLVVKEEPEWDGFKFQAPKVDLPTVVKEEPEWDSYDIRVPEIKLDVKEDSELDEAIVDNPSSSTKLFFKSSTGTEDSEDLNKAKNITADDSMQTADTNGSSSQVPKPKGKRKLPNSSDQECTEKGTRSMHLVKIKWLDNSKPVVNKNLQDSINILQKGKAETKKESAINAKLNKPMLNKVLADAKNGSTKAKFLMEQLNCYGKDLHNWSAETLRICKSWALRFPDAYNECSVNILNLPTKEELDIDATDNISD